MPRMVAITTKYRNGRKAQVGWYCPKNADMVESSFTLNDFNHTIVRFKQAIEGKILKGDSITITISQSYSETEKGHFKVEMSMPLKAINRLIVFERINHILNFKA